MTIFKHVRWFEFSDLGYSVCFRIMGSTTIRDILTAFSPSLDYFAISAGDGRVKVAGSN